MDERERLRGRTLRVGVPIPNTETKYLQKGGLDPKGPMWEFMEFIAEEVNMTLNLQIISQESIDKAEQNHNWWGCIHEVATNVTDICIGDFWASFLQAGFHDAFCDNFISQKAQFLMVLGMG